MKCTGCDYDAKDELDMLAHLTECPNEPESKWATYLTMELQPEIKNSDILKEE